ncbi:hypothetical protein CAEBREN_24782 [Caenorhabditis brenneri]|uniref:Protein kinase domain-containing protein n=1 Tax=Caenorhabditis brenneri TaxID=135651 RepID=G0MQR4_CAEBE|nr:hypothetical protein CAEBREN_24782 [Caenorhabditis brenneri]
MPNIEEIKAAGIPMLNEEATEKPTPKVMAKASDYKIMKALGNGGYGMAYLVIDSNNGKEYAMKAVSKGYIVETNDFKSCKREVQIMKQLDSVFVTKLYAVYQTPLEVCYVMDLCTGGNFYNLMRTFRRLKTHVARFYLAELFCGIKYLHSIDIAHQDLKLDNLLLDSAGHLKICDYGMSSPGMEEDTKITKYCGVIWYFTPEKVLGIDYTRNTDWWNFGLIILHFFGCNQLFARKSDSDCKLAILTLDMIGIRNVPKHALHLANNLIQYEENRYTQEQISSHQFFDKIVWDDIENQRVRPKILWDRKAQMENNYLDEDLRDHYFYLATDENEKLFEDFNFKRPE